MMYGRAEAQLMHGASTSKYFFLDLYINVPQNIYSSSSREAALTERSLEGTSQSPETVHSGHMKGKKTNNKQNKTTSKGNKINK